MGHLMTLPLTMNMIEMDEIELFHLILLTVNDLIYIIIRYY